MKTSFITFLATALATVSAMPHTALHAVKAGNLARSTTLVARQGNIDWVHGTCGGSTGFVCQSGSCCSQHGYCGTTPEYCNGGNPGNGGGGGGGGGGDITCANNNRRSFSGDGSTGAGWPGEDRWASFDKLWDANMHILQASCTQFGQANNSPTEIQQIKDAILSISAQSGVDSRFVLATIIQESKGCVRVWTTFGSHANPGLMQDHNGAYSCFGVNPCPNDQIVGMIRSGTMGTPQGDGLQQILRKLSTSGSQKIYQAARVYNSGSLPGDGNLSNGGATNSYSSDIANRLTGCTF